MKLKPLLLPLIVVTIIAAVIVYWRSWLHERRAAEAVVAIAPKPRVTTGASQQPAPLPGATKLETAHYTITTTAGDAETRQVGEAVEGLYAAYAGFFADRYAIVETQTKLQLTLYQHQGEFKANNRSMPWAEAYYLRPVCYAYYASGEANPYHWMIHEATHQLNTEVAGFKKAKWIDEGLATYFGTSRIEGGRLLAGQVDPNTYPIWWLSSSGLTGNLDADIEATRWIPIRALITGKDAPNIASNVNRYYIQYWSLTHFLFHGENGRYANAYRQLISEGGSLANFEKRIGPADKIEYEWYRYLRDKTAQLAPQSSGDEATVVVWSQ